MDYGNNLPMHKVATMSATPDTFPAITSIPASRGLRWCIDGLRLWRRAPLKLFLLCLAQLAVEGLLQWIPWAGVTLSKIAVPLVVFGILLGLDECAHGGRMRWASLFDGFRRRPFLPVLTLAALYGLSVFGVQQFIAWLAYGWPAVDAVWLGHITAHRGLMTPEFERTLLLPGILPSVLLLLAPCLFLFDGVSPWRAITLSVRGALRWAAPFSAFLLVALGLFLLMLATHWSLVLVLFISPWSLACTYAIWSDVRPAASTITAES